MGQWKQQRDRKRMITWGIVGVVLIVAAVIVYQWMHVHFMDRLEMLRAEPAKQEILEIAEGAIAYEKDKGMWPEKYALLEDFNYHRQNEESWDKWYFIIYPERIIEARATSHNELVGAGERLFYDVEKDVFWGYGCETLEGGDPEPPGPNKE